MNIADGLPDVREYRRCFGRGQATRGQESRFFLVAMNRRQALAVLIRAGFFDGFRRENFEFEDASLKIRQGRRSRNFFLPCRCRHYAAIFFL